MTPARRATSAARVRRAARAAAGARVRGAARAARGAHPLPDRRPPGPGDERPPHRHAHRRRRRHRRARHPVLGPHRRRPGGAALHARGARRRRHARRRPASSPRRTAPARPSCCSPTSNTVLAFGAGAVLRARRDGRRRGAGRSPTCRSTRPPGRDRLAGARGRRPGGARRRAGVSLVPMATPTSTDARLDLVAAAATCFVYCVAVTGVTGARAEVGARAAGAARAPARAHGRAARGRLRHLDAGAGGRASPASPTASSSAARSST